MKKMKYIEVVFDIGYLVFVIIAGLYMVINYKTEIVKLYGIMSLVLGIGDSFHLIPRVIRIITNKNLDKYLGFGKLVTSITMTVFYMTLYYIYCIGANTQVNKIVYILALIRIILCLLPQNNWFENEDNVKWGIYRNIPFVLMAIIIGYYYLNPPFIELNYMSISIFLSFLFYMPVVLFAGKYKIVGALMLPKTMVYIYMVIMGLQLMN